MILKKPGIQEKQQYAMSNNEPQYVNIATLDTGIPDKQCSFCTEPAIGVTHISLFFGCKKHLIKARDKTAKNLLWISRHGIHKWFERGKPL